MNRLIPPPIFSNRPILWMLLWLLAGACVDRIEFDTPDELGRLVVYGRVTTTLGPQTVRMGQIPGFGGESLVPVEDASIVLWEDGANAFPYRLEGGDTYVLEQSDFAGKPGHSYHVEIQLPDGRTLLSEPELMPEPAELTDIRYLFGEREELTRDDILVTREVVQAIVDTRIPKMERGPYLRWQGEEIFIFQEVYYPWWPMYFPETCYIYDYPDGQEVKLFNGDEIEVAQYDDLVVFDRPFDSTFSWKHYFNVYLSSMTPEAMAYWELVDQNVNRVGNIFDSPPAPIPGNLYNPDDPQDFVLGFFEANSEDTIRTFSLPGDFWPLRRVPRACLPQRFDGWQPIYAGHCFNCTSLEGATLERPVWF